VQRVGTCSDDDDLTVGIDQDIAGNRDSVFRRTEIISLFLRRESRVWRCTINGFSLSFDRMVFGEEFNGYQYIVRDGRAD
jgi:hypothetical protein